MHPGIWTRVSRRATNNNNNQNIGKKNNRWSTKLIISLDSFNHLPFLFVQNIRYKCSKWRPLSFLRRYFVSSSWSLKKISIRIIWNFSHHFVELHRGMNCIRWKFDGSICTRIQNNSDADSWFSNELSWVMHMKRISFLEHLHLSQPIYLWA